MLCKECFGGFSSDFTGVLGIFRGFRVIQGAYQVVSVSPKGVSWGIYFSGDFRGTSEGLREFQWVSSRF